MFTENKLYNIVIAWIEETLDTVEAFTGVQVIRAGQDMPRPNSAGEGTSVFVAVDLTADNALDQEPLYCEQGLVDGCLERTRNVIREVTFSINVFREGSYDAARLLQSHLEGHREAQIFFAPHGIAMNRYDQITRLREIIHAQWEHRTQFNVFFRYVDVVTERDAVMAGACVQDQEILAADCAETTTC